MKQTLSLVLLTALALGACSPAQPPPPPAAPVEAPPPAPPQPGLSWTRSATGEGAALTLLDAAGAPLLRLGCIRNPATMTLRIEGFAPIASEDRLTVGLDDELFVFVADLTAAAGQGVAAEAPIDASFLDRLQSPSAISAVYGAQRLGPHMPPPAAMAGTFAAECRRAVAVS